MDFIYKEMSYPYFGKKICRGGCFAVSDFLIHSKYRNARYSCPNSIIGFRVCLNSSKMNLRVLVNEDEPPTKSELSGIFMFTDFLNAIFETRFLSFDF